MERTLFPGLSRLLPVVLLASVLALPATAQDMKPDTEERVKNATVMVFTARSEQGKGDKPQGSGSGFFINSTGLLISNNHVVDPEHGKSYWEKNRGAYNEGKTTWTVITDSGTDDEKTFDAEVLYQNETADQAILQAFTEDGEKLESPNYLRLMPDTRLKERLKVFALGFPGGDGQKTVKDKHPEVSITEGHVLGIPYTPGGRIRMVYTDVIARPGNSGGPMVNLDGYLVGTVTLMKAPEGREDSGGAKYSALVPAALSGEMIRNGFVLGKMPDASDVTPFMEMLTEEDGHMDIPEFKRRERDDVLHYDDGDRIYGSVKTDTITWNSPLGKLTVSASAVAYVMNNEEGAHLFLEGGNRIAADDSGSNFKFAPIGGAEMEQAFDDVQVVGFRTGERNVRPYKGDTIILDSDLTHLRLAEVEGAVKFKTKIGDIDLKLEDIARVDRNEDDEPFVILKDGRRMTGEFGDQKFKAIIAATRTPIEFGLNEVTTALIEPLTYREDRVAGLDIDGVLASAGREVRSIVELLEVKGDAAGARAKVEKVMSDTKAFRQRTIPEKDAFKLLRAYTALRDGDGPAAAKFFRKARTSDDLNISAFATACSALVKRYDGYEYEGKSLSDKRTFMAAGEALSLEHIAKVRDVVSDNKRLEGKNRGEYFRCLSAAKKHEADMRVAAVFAGTVAEDEMVRLWKLGRDAAVKEIRRIDQALEEQGVRGGGQNNRRGNNRRNVGGSREVQELNEHREQTMEKYWEFRLKLREYGFRIEDTDIQGMREKEAERGDDDNEPEEESDEP